MSEDRSVIYKIRWEILVMAVSLILSAVVVLTIPNDFTDRMIEQQRQEREAQRTIEMGENLGLTEGISGPVPPP